MGLGLGVFFVEDGLADVLGQDFVEDVVSGDGQGGLSLEQLLNQQGVEVVWIHHVVFPPEK